jgi:hypothetical protein
MQASYKGDLAPHGGRGGEKVVGSVWKVESQASPSGQDREYDGSWEVHSFPQVSGAGTMEMRLSGDQEFGFRSRASCSAPGSLPAPLWRS